MKLHAVQWLGHSMMRRIWAIACWLGLWVAPPALAQFTQITTPDAAYTSATTQIAITAANGTSLGSLADGLMTLTLSTNMDVATVGVVGWSTWGAPPNTEGATPRVLARYSTLATQTITLSRPTTIFGLEIEPNTFGDFSISVAFMNGAATLGTVTRTVNGNAGARLFAASSTTPITSVVITANSGGNGYAVARPRYATVIIPPAVIPTLSEWGMIALMLVMAALAAFAMRNGRTRQ